MSSYQVKRDVAEVIARWRRDEREYAEANPGPCIYDDIKFISAWADGPDEMTPEVLEALKRFGRYLLDGDEGRDAGVIAAALAHLN